MKFLIDLYILFVVSILCCYASEDIEDKTNSNSSSSSSNRSPNNNIEPTKSVVPYHEFEGICPNFQK